VTDADAMETSIAIVRIAYIRCGPKETCYRDATFKMTLFRVFDTVLSSTVIDLNNVENGDFSSSQEEISSFYRYSGNGVQTFFSD